MDYDWLVVGSGFGGILRLLPFKDVLVASGSLARISDRLSELVRTNSESILAVTLPDDSSKPVVWRLGAMRSTAMTELAMSRIPEKGS